MHNNYVRITLITDENIIDVLKSRFKPFLESLSQQGYVKSFYFAQYIQHKKIVFTISGNQQKIIEYLQTEILNKVQHQKYLTSDDGEKHETKIEESFDSDNDDGEIKKYGNKERWLCGRIMRELASKTALDFIDKIGKSNDLDVVSQDLVHWLLQNIGYFTNEEINICLKSICSRIKN